MPRVCWRHYLNGEVWRNWERLAPVFREVRGRKKCDIRFKHALTDSETCLRENHFAELVLIDVPVKLPENIRTDETVLG